MKAEEGCLFVVSPFVIGVYIQSQGRTKSTMAMYHMATAFAVVCAENIWKHD